MNAATDSGTAAPAVGASRGLSRRQRIVRTSQFNEAYDQGRCYRGRLIAMWLRVAPDAALRLGVVTGRRVGEATARVRARRLMREAFRLNRAKFCGGVDIVLSARSNICSVKMQDVEAELLFLARKAGILRK